MKHTYPFKTKILYFLLAFAAQVTFAQVQPGDIVITEIMKKPQQVADDDGEWIEVYNTSNAPIDLQGFLLIDSDQQNGGHSIATSVIVQPQSYAVLAANNNNTTNGGITVVDYEYDTLGFADGNDGVNLMLNGVIIDQVIYDTTNFPNEDGKSLELANNAIDATLNDEGQYWASAVDTYGDGDLGTPGNQNSFEYSVGFGLGINQISGPNPTSMAGDVLEYEITVVNIGTIPLTDLMTSFVFPDGSNELLVLVSGDENSNNELDTDETWQYASSYTVSQADIDFGIPLVSQACLSVDELDSTSCSTIETPVNGINAIAVTKIQAGGPNPVTAAGQTLNYAITAENTGTTTITNVNPMDTLSDGTNGALIFAGGDSDNDGELDVDETFIYVVSYTVTQADIDDCSELVNTVSVTTDQIPDPMTDTAITPVACNSSFEVTNIQTGGPNPFSAAGQTLDYTITVENTGNNTLTHVLASYIFPDQFTSTLTLVSGDTDGDNQLDVDETWAYMAFYIITQADVDNAETLTGTACVTTDEVPNQQCDSFDCVYFPIVNDLNLDISADNLSPNIGDEITLILTVTNEGPDNSSAGGEVTNTLPAGLAYISSNGNYDEVSGIWGFSSLAVDESSSLEITAVVHDTPDYTNCAEITSDTNLDPDSTPNNGDESEDDYACITFSPNLSTLVFNNMVVSLYPNPINPTNGDIQIRSNQPGEMILEIFDVLGKKVFRKIVKTEANLYGLASGIYIVRLSQNDQVFTKKLIVE